MIPKTIVHLLSGGMDSTDGTGWFREPSSKRQIASHRTIYRRTPKPNTNYAMTTKYTEPELIKLHDLYCRLSGRTMAWQCTRRFAWESFVYRGFTISDLELVLRYVSRMIELGKRRPESLRFERVVIDLDHFEDDLAEAKAARGLNIKRKGEQRAPRDKVAVLEATGRVEEIPDKVTTPSTVIGKRTVEELIQHMRRAAL